MAEIKDTLKLWWKGLMLALVTGGIAPVLLTITSPHTREHPKMLAQAFAISALIAIAGYVVKSPLALDLNGVWKWAFGAGIAILSGAANGLLLMEIDPNGMIMWSNVWIECTTQGVANLGTYLLRSPVWE